MMPMTGFWTRVLVPLARVLSYTVGEARPPVMVPWMAGPEMVPLRICCTTISVEPLARKGGVDLPRARVAVKR